MAAAGYPDRHTDGRHGRVLLPERGEGSLVSIKKDGLKEALRKEVPPSAFVISRNDWIVGKINHIGRLQNGKVHLQREERALV